MLPGGAGDRRPCRRTPLERAGWCWCWRPAEAVAIVGRARCLRTGDVATGERLLKPSAVAEVAAGSAELDDYLAARLSAKMLPAAACSARGAQRLASAPRDGILG